MAIHQCPRCELRFRTEAEYHDHLRMEHGVDPTTLNPIRYASARQQKPLYPDLTEQQSDHIHRVMVVGNATLRAQRLQDSLTERAAGGPTAFLLVVPAVETSAVAGEHSWFETVGAAHPREESLTGHMLAQRRMDEAVDRLREAGVDIDGMVGDADVMRAVQQARQSFAADEIVLATLPPARSRWLAADLPEELRRRYNLPVTVVAAA